MEGGREERGLLGNKATFKIDGPRYHDMGHFSASAWRLCLTRVCHTCVASACVSGFNRAARTESVSAVCHN